MEVNKDTLKDLQFSEIRRIVRYKDIEGNEKQITIFNPTDEKGKKLLGDLIANSEFTETDMNINFNYFLFSFVKQLTDIPFPDSKEEAITYLSNPDIPLKKVILELSELLADLIELNIKEGHLVDKSKLKAEELSELTSKCKNLIDILKKVKQ